MSHETQLESLRGGEQFFAELVRSSDSLASVADRFSVEDVVRYIERRAGENRGLIESQKNGAVRDLTNFLIFKSSSITVQEASNTAAVLLGVSKEFGDISVAKLPQLAQWTTDKKLQRNVMGQMMRVLATAEMPSMQSAANAGITAQRLQPVAKHVMGLVGLETSSNGEIPALPPATSTSEQIVKVRAQSEQDIRSLLGLLLVTVPILLASLEQGARGVAILLLFFFVALLNDNRRLAADVFNMLENASRS